MTLSSQSPVQSSFPDPSQLHENLKKVVWSIKIVYKVKEGVNKQPVVCARGFGFSVTPSGYIMTCARIFINFDSNEMEIMARTLDQDTFKKAKLKLRRSQWNLALLKTKVDKFNGCEYASFSEDGTLRAGQSILTIGRTSHFMGSCRYGNVAAGHTQVTSLRRLNRRLNSNKKCEDHFFNAYFYNRSLSSNTSTMGCFWNMNFFFREDSSVPKPEPEPENTEPEPENTKLYEFERQLHPHVPVVHCDGFSTNHYQSFAGGESQGSPIFNLAGEVVGMLSSKFHNFDVAIHVSALLRFKTASLSVGPVFRLQRTKRKGVLQRKRRKHRLGKFHMLGIRRT